MEILKLKTEKALLGKFGERAAVRYLRRSGYRILKRSFVANNHEIDVIATNKEYVAFIEVKTRTLGKESGKECGKEPRPASAVTAKKQRSIIAAAKCYIAFNRSDKKKRFDVVEVYVNQNNGKYIVAEIKHLKNTFNLNTAYEQ